jgi:hypothetical protein
MKSSIIRHIHHIYLVFALQLFIFGCTSNRPLTADYSRVPLESTDFNRVFDVCQVIMRAEFGQISTDEQSAVIKTKPEYFVEKSPTLSQWQLRKVAVLRLIEHRGQWWGYLQVSVERLDTRTYEQFRPSSDTGDYHIASPMESGETVPRSRKQVWTRLRREHERENQVLIRIRQGIGLQP